MTERKKHKFRLAVCIRNDGYPASLERRKIYRLLADATAEKSGYVRIVDESGEDYLYPAQYFMSIDLPAAVKRAVMHAA